MSLPGGPSPVPTPAPTGGSGSRGAPRSPSAQEPASVQIPHPVRDFRVTVEPDPSRCGFCIRVAPAGQGAAGESLPAPETPASAAGGPPAGAPFLYALWREDGFWELWFDGLHATLRHEQALFYVAHTFGHPGIPVKKLYLATTYARFGRGRAGLTEAWDSQKGHFVPLGPQPVVQRPVVSEDDKEARRALEAEAKDLWAAIADARSSEAEKADARRRLGEIADFLRKDKRLSRDEYKKASDSVREALKHLRRTLLREGGSKTSPPEVRRAFAAHIEDYLLGPSSRYAAPEARGARGERAGCLVYEPPPGVRWVPCRVTALDDPEPFPGESEPQMNTDGH